MFDMVRNDRSHKNGGGLVFFMKENIPYKSLTCFECQDRETLFIEICNCNVSPYLIGCVYIPPYITNNVFDLFKNQLQLFNGRYNGIIPIGNFNLHFDINNGFKNVTWTNLLLEYGFSQMIKLPTRVTAKSSSIIGHMYSTHPEHIIETCVPSTSMSDHFPVCSN